MNGSNILSSGELGFSYQIVRSARRKKTVAIKVEDNMVKVLVPQRLSQKEALAFLHEKKSWVSKRLAEQLATPPKQYQEGEVFWFLGERLVLIFGDTEGIKAQSGHLVCPTMNSKKQLKQLVASWYYHQAVILLEKRTAHFAKVYGLSPASIKVKSYKARWGACSSKGEIFYNWKLVMAPVEVLDYVVVHELCHMIELNHSAQFWQQVAKAIPDYKVKNKWLKSNGSKFRL